MATKSRGDPATAGKCQGRWLRFGGVINSVHMKAGKSPWKVPHEKRKNEQNRYTWILQRSEIRAPNIKTDLGAEIWHPEGGYRYNQLCLGYKLHPCWKGIVATSNKTRYYASLLRLNGSFGVTIGFSPCVRKTNAGNKEVKQRGEVA